MRARRQFSWVLRFFALFAVSSLAMVGFAQATSVEPPQVPLQFDEYIHRADGSPADPVNVIFVAPSADVAAGAVHNVLGWPVVEGSPMSFSDQGSEHATSWQLGMTVSRGSRWHLRIESASQGRPRAYVLAAVHRDDDASCGHIGRAFDPGRATVAEAFAQAGYGVSYVQLGNSNPGPQCDGSFTAGDGTAVVIDLNSGGTRGG